MDQTFPTSKARGSPASKLNSISTSQSIQSMTVRADTVAMRTRRFTSGIEIHVPPHMKMTNTRPTKIKRKSSDMETTSMEPSVPLEPSEFCNSQDVELIEEAAGHVKTIFVPRSVASSSGGCSESNRNGGGEMALPSEQVSESSYGSPPFAQSVSQPTAQTDASENGESEDLSDAPEHFPNMEMDLDLNSDLDMPSPSPSHSVASSSDGEDEYVPKASPVSKKPRNQLRSSPSTSRTLHSANIPCLLPPQPASSAPLAPPLFSLSGSNPTQAQMPSSISPLAVSLFGGNTAMVPIFGLYPPAQAPAGPAISQGDKDWAGEVMQYDDKLNRVRFVLPNPATAMTDHHRLILGEAYKANKHRLDKLRDEDYEFIAVIAEVTPDMVKTFFADQGTAQRIAHVKVTKPSKRLINDGASRTDIGPKSTAAQNSGTAVPRTGYYGKPRLYEDGDFELIVRKRIPPEHRLLQQVKCQRYVALKTGLEPCKPCVVKKAHHPCAFSRLRYFYIESEQDEQDFLKHQYGPDFFSDQRPDKALKFDKNGLGTDEEDYVLAFTHSMARDLLELELEHVSNAMCKSRGASEDENRDEMGDDYVRQPSLDRRYCEICNISTVSGFWMCCVCAQDVCLNCIEKECESTAVCCTQKRQHQRKQFVPSGRFHLSTLRSNFELFEKRLSMVPENLVAVGKQAAFQRSMALKPEETSAVMNYHTPLTAKASNITLTEFRASWSSGKVVLLSGVDQQLQKDWSPAHLKRKHGDDPVTSWNVKTDASNSTTLGEYFDTCFSGKVTPAAWKIQEWPPEPFPKILPELDRDWQRALPLPEYTRPNGVFNLSRYIPMGQVGPDLSPKMYPSQGLGRHCRDHGTMSISVEMSDIIYVCVYTDPLPVKGEGEAYSSSQDPICAVVWEIYSAEDRHLVEAFLETTMKEQKPHSSRLSQQMDPFTSDRHFMSPTQQRKLYRETGARPFQVVQNMGDAVIIPAGCARQARYVQSSILVGQDFVSPERLSATMDWRRDWRAKNLRKVQKRLPDSLMANDILFYSTLAML